MHDIEKEALEVISQVEIIKKASWEEFDEMAVAYGIAQYLNDYIQSSKLTPEQQGEVISTIANNLMEFNRENLGLYNSIRKIMFDKALGNGVTLH